YRDREAVADYQRRLAAEHEPAVLAVPGVAGIWTFETPEELTSPRWSAGARRLTVLRLGDDPVARAARSAPPAHIRTGRLDPAAAVAAPRPGSGCRRPSHAPRTMSTATTIVPTVT